MRKTRTATPLSAASNAWSSLSNVSIIPSSETFAPAVATVSCNFQHFSPYLSSCSKLPTTQTQKSYLGLGGGGGATYDEVVVDGRRGEVEGQGGRNDAAPGRFGRECELLLLVVLIVLGLSTEKRTVLVEIRDGTPWPRIEKQKITRCCHLCCHLFLDWILLLAEDPHSDKTLAILASK